LLINFLNLRAKKPINLWAVESKISENEGRKWIKQG